MPMVWLIGGLVALTLGADGFVRGAAGLGAAFRLSPLVIGLTIVAFGTSSPELAVSVMSAYEGSPEMAVGNVIGSNIFNILVILGISAMVLPLTVARQLVRLDVPLMVVTAFLVLILGWDGLISRVEGIGLFVSLILYTIWLVFKSRKEHDAEVEDEVRTRYLPADGVSRKWFLGRVGLLILGLILLVAGSHFTVQGAVAIAERLEISPLLISLTVVAAGTSLPELATSVMAAWRGHRDIAVGNVVGSCTFNVLCVLGGAAIVAKGGLGLPVPVEALHVDVPIMIAVSLACLPIFVTGHKVARWEGFLLFSYYVAYVVFLWMKATSHAALQTYEIIVMAFVLPLTVWHVLLATVRELRRRKWGSDVPPGHSLD